MSTQVDLPSSLKGFIFDRVLNEDPKTRSASLLGHFEIQGGVKKEAAVLLLEKTHFSPTFYQNVGRKDEDGSLQYCSLLGTNDVYTWLLGWMPTAATTLAGIQHESGDQKQQEIEKDAHVKITMIRPATESHILKYTEQLKVMVVETPEIYQRIIEPWINSQAPERIQWVYNILDKKKEADTILYEKTGVQGFIIVPDLKWDRKTLSSLYLVAIVHDRSLRSLRHLTKDHIPLLQSIKEQGEKLARDRYSLWDEKNGFGKLRCFLHYHPTYYDFTSHPGAIVGQAHLLEDIIDLLRMGVDFKKRTFTYSLGEQSQLLKEIQTKIS